jgi:3-hydroxyisobutyrate dehydrogenase-like beta-hydroxyacid dehydrogenase
MNYNVTVIGAGRMGSALATVLFHKGFATTVWNRTGAKTKVLSRLGLSVAESLEESVREADIVVVSVSDYSSTRQLLRQPDIETALRGKIVVQLSSGTPKEAREMDSWARRCGISYLDGAILGSPEWIGTPACTIFYSGPAEVFNRAKPVLMVFGDRTLFVGHEIGHASAFDVAVLTFEGAFQILPLFRGLHQQVSGSALPVPYVDAAGFPLWYGLPSRTSFSEAYSSFHTSGHPGHEELVT